MTDNEYTETEMWAARFDTPDGPRYQEQADQGMAELVADSVATHLDAVAAGRDRRASGLEVTAVAVVRRTRREMPDGSEHLSTWMHVRDGQPVTEG